MRNVDLRTDRLLVMIMGGVPSSVASYGTESTGVEFDRPLTCFQPVCRKDLLHSRGICTCIFLARRRNEVACWLGDVEGRSYSESCTIGVACCILTVFSTLFTVAILQYDTPPMSGGEGVLLALSHALMSLATPELGLDGRSGGWMEELCMLRWMLIGIGGMEVIVFASDSMVMLDKGASPGRCKDAVSRSPPSPMSLLGWKEGSFRRRRCSHCFAVSGLPDAENVLLVFGAVMFNVAEEATGEDVGH
jgi:hypothetical protein